MKRNPEMGETAEQPLPAQTADLSISGLRFIFPLCTSCLSSRLEELRLPSEAADVAVRENTKPLQRPSET